MILFNDSYKKEDEVTTDWNLSGNFATISTNIAATTVLI